MWPMQRKGHADRGQMDSVYASVMLDDGSRAPSISHPEVRFSWL
jgi:hypothetical protein